MKRLRDVGEFEAIRRLIAARPAGPGVVIGSGDDAAVLRPRPGKDLVATTDAFVEGAHYRTGWLPAADVGARLAAANLSDLAAMAAGPRWGLISMGVRPERELDELLALDRGIAGMLGGFGAVLVGGNLTAVEGPEWVSLTLLGECDPGRAWRRRGARPGDLVAVTGSPGRAGAALALLQRRGRAPGAADAWRPLFDAWARPAVRLELAALLVVADVVTAAIDVSDGFAADLRHLCEASGVGAEIDESAWPRDALLEQAALELELAPPALLAASSDDYELVLAVRPESRAACETAARDAGTPLAFVGRFTGRRGEIEWVARSGARTPLGSAGWDHFAAPRS